MPPAVRVAAARAAAKTAEEEEGVDPSSLPRLLAGAGAQSVVHAVLRVLVKEHGNLTLGMQDYLRYVSSETDMTHGAILTVLGYWQFLDSRAEACSSATRLLGELF